VADAYYVLSDPQRRKEYDALLRSRGYQTSGFASSAAGAGANASSGSGASFGSTDPAASAAFFEQFWQYFSKATGSNHSAQNKEKDDSLDEESAEDIPASAGAWNAGARPNAEGVFTDVFEELLRPEVQRTINWWTYLGAISGASLGFILANIPGALAGGLAGNRLGAVRDAKGKPVVQVFSELGGTERAQVGLDLPCSMLQR
jgi:curved DNA-binding protein CbpA